MANKKIYKLIILLISIISLLLSYYLLNTTKYNNNVTETNSSTGSLKNELVSESTVDLNILVNQQKFNQVLPILENRYNINPEIANILNYANVLSNIGSLTRKEKEYGEKAILLANKALEFDSNNSEAYRIIGYSYEIMEKYDKAFLNYTKAIELDKNNALAFSNRGHAYRLIGENDKALQDFLKAYYLNKNIDHTVINLALIYLSKGETDKALDFYNKLLEISKNSRFRAEALYTIGTIETNKGNIVEANKIFQNTIDEDPNFELGYIGLSKSLFIQFLNEVKNDRENANNALVDQSIENLNKAIKLNPNKTLAYYQLALIYMDLGKYGETEKNFKKALDVVSIDITLSKIEKEDMLQLIKNNY